jgi:WD40 repeat protein
LNGENFRCVTVDLTELGSLLTAEQWYCGIVESVAEQLNFPDARSWWHAQGNVGIGQRFIRFFREMVMPAIPERVVIFVDEIDSTLQLPFTDDFFAAVRALYQLRANAPALNRLSFVLIGVASPDDLMKDARRTPFNIGERVELTDFTASEARPLVERLHLDPLAATVFLDWVLGWTGGHPYLTLRVFRKFQEEDLDWAPNDAVIEELFFGSKNNPDSNLEFVRKMLLKEDPIRRGVLATLQAILRGQGVRDDGPSEIRTCLKLSGIVSRVQDVLRIRNLIYERTFNEAWLLKVRRDLERKESPAIEEEATAAGPLEQRTGAVSGEEITQAHRLARAAARARGSEQEVDLAVLLAVESVKIWPDREALQILREDLPLLRKLRHEYDHGQRVTSLAFSRDGRYTASAGEDRVARVFSIAERSEVATLRHRDRVAHVVFSPDSKLVVTSSWDGTAKVWNLRGHALVELPHGDCVQSSVFSNLGGMLATACWDHKARIWDLRRVREEMAGLYAVVQHDDRVAAASFSEDEDLLLTASWDRTARIWDVSNLSERSRMMHEGRVVAAKWSREGKTVLTASDDGTAGAWDAATGRRTAILRHGNRVTSIAFSANPRLAASGSEDKTARVWDSLTGRQVVCNTHLARVIALDCDAHGHLASASEDGTARIWALETGREAARLTHRGRLTDVAFSPDGHLAMTGSDDGKVRLWEVRTSAETACYQHRDRVRGIAFSPDGGHLLSGGEDRTARVWNYGKAREVLRLTHEGRITSVAFANEHSYMATTGEDAQAYVWDSRGLTRAALPHPSWVYCSAFHPRQPLLATGCNDGKLRLWNYVTMREPGEYVHRGPVRSVVFLRRGRLVASGGSGPRVRLWYAEQPSQSQPLREVDCDEEVYCLAAHPEQPVLASGAADGVTRLWDAETGREVQRLEAEGGVYSLAFHPSGNLIGAGYGDGMVRIWNLESGLELVRWREHGAVDGIAFHPSDKVVAVAVEERVQMCFWDREEMAAYARGRISRRLTASDLDLSSDFDIVS